MDVTREDLNACTVKLTVKTDEGQVKTALDKALKQIAKKIKLPGFRPGHAPKAMVESMIDKNDWHQEAAEGLVRDLYKPIIEQQSLTPDNTTSPTVDFTFFKPEELQAEFTIKVPLPPKVELGEYKGLPLEKPPIEVTDDEVDYQLNEFRSRRQTRETITERGAQEGDIAVISVKPAENGEPRNFMTIAGQTFPQLDEALLGMRVEEMKNLDLTFPDTFQEKDWAGTSMHATVSLTSLSAVRLPELDDSFAQELKTDSLDDLKAKIRVGIEHAKEQMLQDYVSEQLLKELHEKSQVETSENMWEALADRRLRETAVEQSKEGKSLEDYAKENGMTIEELVAAWRENAKLHVERALLIREVFVKEGMTLTNEDLNVELMALADEAGVEPKEMVEVLRRNEALDELQFRAISRKVGQFLEDNAKVTEGAAA